MSQKEMYDMDNPVHSLYMIQLMDYNCPTCCSGVTQVFAEDIEQFAQNYQCAEKNKSRIERFLRSKEGEIVTDYYSDDPALNIVQKLDVHDYGCVKISRQNVELRVLNGYGFEAEYFFEELVCMVRWIRIQDKFYKLVKPAGKKGLNKNFISINDSWVEIIIFGNPFWLSQEEILESYVWQVAEIFEEEEAMRADMKNEWLTKRQISNVFADLPGEAG